MKPKTEDKVVRLEIRGNLLKFFNGLKDTELILDGPAGTGKTRIILERQHRIQMKYPMSRGLILRKFRSSMNETVLEVLNNEVFHDDKGDRYPDAPVWRERDQKYVYDNGSEIVVAGMDDPGKVMSSRYDWAYWNEAIEGKRAEWEAVMSRLRNFKVPYQQMIGDTNPGPPTHWIKKFSEEGKLTLLPTFHKDNPVYWDEREGKWTDKGEMYVNKILRDGLTGLRRSRLYEGKWTLAEGMIYDSFDHNVHVCARFEPPRNWVRVWAFDFGFIDPFVWQEWVEDPATGTLYLYRELYHSGMTIDDAIRAIKTRCFPLYSPMALICDHDADKRAQLERQLEMLTLPAFKLIHPGIDAVKKRLEVPKSTGRPRLMIMENAGILIDPALRDRHHPTSTLDEFDSYVWDTGKISIDKYKDMPVDRYNHGMDAMRYAVAFMDDSALDPQQFEAIGQHNPIDPEEEEREQLRREEMEYMMRTMISPL